MDEETRCYEEEMLERAARATRRVAAEDTSCRRCAGLAVCYCDDAPVEYDEDEEFRETLNDYAYEAND